MATTSSCVGVTALSISGLGVRNAALDCVISGPSSSGLDFGGARGARPVLCSSSDGVGLSFRCANANVHAQHQCSRRRGRQPWGGAAEGNDSAPINSNICSRPYRSPSCLRAKRKSGGEGAIRQLQNGDEQELDEDMRLGLNEISTEALKAMLSEDDKVVEELREKVEDIESYLTRLEQFDASKFMLVVKGLLDHEVVPATKDLKGAYKSALDRITSVIEDSGWVLKREGADLGGVEMVDEELMPPVLNSQY